MDNFPTKITSCWNRCSNYAKLFIIRIFNARYTLFSEQFLAKVREIPEREKIEEELAPIVVVWERVKKEIPIQSSQTWEFKIGERPFDLD